LKGFGIEGCKQITELIMRRRAVLESKESAQEIKFLLTELGDLHPAIGTSQYSQKTLQQHLFKRICNLTALARVLDLVKMLQPFNDLIISVFSLRLGAPHVRPPSESEDIYRFSNRQICHLQIHAIALE
jgi:hypothetical protein